MGVSIAETVHIGSDTWLHAADVSHACCMSCSKAETHEGACLHVLIRRVKSISLQVHGAAHVRELYLWM